MDKETELYCYECNVFLNGPQRAGVHAGVYHALNLKGAMDRGVIGKVI